MKKGVKNYFHAQSYHFLGKTELETSPVGIGLRYFVNCYDVSGYSHRNIVLDGSLINIVKCILHDPV